MTEAEWLAAKNPGPMVDHLRDRVSDRKMRLFACVCCRQVWPLLGDERSRTAVEVAEQFADRGTKSWARLAVAEAEAWKAAGTLLVSSDPALSAAARAAALTTLTTGRRREPWWLHHQNAWDTISRDVAGPRDRRPVKALQAALLRDVIGHPFYPVEIVPSWLAWSAGAVSELARSIYEERAFDRLPILGDALEEAGCADAAILNHCRGPGPHVRGCRVVDLLLGKS
jgi:hypothetical protein